MHRPPTLRPSRRQPRHERGVLRARLLRPAGRHAMVVAHFFESGQRRRLRWGRVESAPLMAGAVALASTGYIAAIDEKAWAGHVGSARASRVPHSVSRHCHGDSSRAEYARRRSSHPFGAGAGSQPSCGRRGQAVVRRTVPLRSLDDCSSLRVINSFTAPFYYDLPKRPPKISGCLRIERNTNILGRPATGRVTSRRIVPESAKDTPNSCDKVARLRSYEIRVASEQVLTYCSYVHTGL